MLRFTSALQVAAIPDEQLEDRFEVIMPTLDIGVAGKELIPTETGESLVGNYWNKMTGSSYCPIVEEIVFGTMNFKTDTRRVRTGWYNLPTDIENYKEVSITMFCSVGMLTQYYLETWKRLIFDPYGEYYNPGSVYKKNIEVYFEGIASAPSFDLMAGGDAAHSMHITLAGCFPSMQDSYKLSYSADPKRMRLTQKFKVDKVIIDTSKAYYAVGMDNVATPTSLISNAISNFGLGTQTTDYDIKSIYDAKQAANIANREGSWDKFKNSF